MKAGGKPAHQVLGALHAGDAVGNEALAIQAALRRAGRASEIFAGSVDRELVGAARPLAEYGSVSSPGALCLFHFAPGSPAGRVIEKAPDQLVLVYHNLTPPSFLAPFDPALARRHHEGLRELRALGSRAVLALAHSEFSRRDLVELGFGDRARVLPFAVDLGARRRPAAPVLLRLFGDGRTTLLAVGRIAPNKKLEDLIRSFAAFRERAGRRNRLLLVGDTQSFPRYVRSLVALTRSLRLDDDVVFTGHVADDDLHACYRVADVFVSLSEHEGFGVPLVEAMLHDVPVLAYDAGAVAETLAGGGMLLTQKPPALVAALLQELATDPALRTAVLATQRRALARLRERGFEALLLGELERLAA